MFPGTIDPASLKKVKKAVDINNMRITNSR